MPNDDLLMSSDLASNATAAMHQPQDPKRRRTMRATSVSPTREAKVRNTIGNGATKAEIILKKLSGSKGASLQVLMELTGWQAHSVRGFLSGTVKKKLGHTVISEIGKDGLRRYRIAAAAVGA